MQPDERKEFYSKIASRYDRVAVGKVGYVAHERVPSRLLKLVSRVDKLRVLDLGCGTGLTSVPFFERGFTVVGIDYAPGMIEIARQRPFTQLFCQSIEEEFPVDDNQFDIVTAIGVTEFIKDPHKLLIRILEKMTDGGVVAMTAAKPNGVAESMGVCVFDKNEFLSKVDQEVFEILEIDEFFGWESGHLSSDEENPVAEHHRFDYFVVFLRKRKSTN